jgi:hypothetical protein
MPRSIYVKSSIPVLEARLGLERKMATGSIETELDEGRRQTIRSRNQDDDFRIVTPFEEGELEIQVETDGVVPHPPSGIIDRSSGVRSVVPSGRPVPFAAGAAKHAIEHDHVRGTR